MNIGEKIKNRRIELGLTMKQVAEAVGVSESAVSRWESGDVDNMRRDRIAQLAKILRVSPLYIVFEETEIEEKPTTTGGLSKDKAALIDLVKTLSEEEVQAVLRLLRR